MKLYVYFLFWHYVLQSKHGFACSDGLFMLIPVYFISWTYHNLFAWSDIHGHWDSRSGLFCIVPGWILKYFLMNFCMSLHSSSYRTYRRTEICGSWGIPMFRLSRCHQLPKEILTMYTLAKQSVKYGEFLLLKSLPTLGNLFFFPFHFNHVRPSTFFFFLKTALIILCFCMSS